MTTDNNQLENIIENTEPIVNETVTVQTQKIKEIKSTEKSEFEVLKNLNRILPDLINKLIDDGFDIKLTKNGYAIGGFYGLKGTSGIGWADIYETDDENVLCLLDHKKQKTFVKSINDIVLFNHYIWKSFYNKNKEDYALTVDNIWFKYLNQANLLTYSPL